MSIRLSHATVLVRDQQEALKFYTEKLGFEKRSEQPMGPNSFWVTVAAPGDSIEIVLEPLDWYEGEERTFRESQIGHTSSPVFAVSDCQATYEEWAGRGVEFASKPETLPWGVQAVARDIYGNSIVLVQAPQQ